MLHATWLHLPGAVAKFNYSCAINRLTYINIYIAEMQSVANGFMGRSPSVRGALRWAGGVAYLWVCPCICKQFSGESRGRWSSREMELRRQ